MVDRTSVHQFSKATCRVEDAHADVPVSKTTRRAGVFVGAFVRVYVFVFVSVRVCVRARVHVRVRMFVCVCMLACASLKSHLQQQLRLA